jgi:hypothetical protein
MRLVLPFLEACKLPVHLFFPAIHANLAVGHLPAALVLNVLLKLLYSHIFELDVCLCLPVDSIVGLKLLLKLDDCLISLIEPTSKSNHDISLLQQELLVPIYLLLVLLDLDTLLLDLLHLLVKFHSHDTLFLFEGISELREILYFLTTDEDLRVHGLDFLF